MYPFGYGVSSGINIRGLIDADSLRTLAWQGKERATMTEDQEKELLAAVKSIDHTLKHLLRHAQVLFAAHLKIPPVTEPEPQKPAKRPGTR